jgi:hypothetical protein
MKRRFKAKNKEGKEEEIVLRECDHRFREFFDYLNTQVYHVQYTRHRYCITIRAFNTPEKGRYSFIIDFFRSAFLVGRVSGLVGDYVIQLDWKDGKITFADADVKYDADNLCTSREDINLFERLNKKLNALGVKVWDKNKKKHV